MNFGATQNVLNTGNEIIECHKKLLRTSIFVLWAANNTELQLHGTMKLDIKHRNSQNTVSTLNFLVSDTQFKMLGTPFPGKTVEPKKCTSHTLERKHNYEKKHK